MAFKHSEEKMESVTTKLRARMTELGAKADLQEKIVHSIGSVSVVRSTVRFPLERPFVRRLAGQGFQFVARLPIGDHKRSQQGGLGAQRTGNQHGAEREGAANAQRKLFVPLLIPGAVASAEGLTWQQTSSNASKTERETEQLSSYYESQPDSGNRRCQHVLE